MERLGIAAEIMDTRATKSFRIFSDAGIRGPWPWLRRVFLAPRSVLEDDRRKEFILNVILLTGLVLLALFDFFILYDSLTEADYRGMSLLSFSLPLLSVAALLALSRLGYFRWSAYITIGIFCAVIFYSARTWGMDLPAVLLGYALVVAASSILVSTRFGITVACLGTFVLAYFGYQEIQGRVLPDHYWKSRVLRVDNVIEYSSMLFYLALISALSNSEIDKSLKRARRSEAALKRERDNLELTVEERTRELRHSQDERLLEQAQFVELGRQAGGYVHDLVNPLTVLSLSMDRLKAEGFGQASEALTAALNAGKRMQSLVVALRKQIRGEQAWTEFSLSQELRDAVQLLEHAARMAGVDLLLRLPEADIRIFGSASRFHQIASNLIANGIEAYAGIAGGRRREVLVNLVSGGELVSVIVKDCGSGIATENLDQIFTPFFSTKPGRGLGIGLPTVKAIVEKDFGGRITVSSRPGQGAEFIVRLPLRGEMANVQPEII